MAAPYKKTVIKTHPKISEKVTSDTLYWKNLEVGLRHLYCCSICAHNSILSECKLW